MRLITKALNNNKQLGFKGGTPDITAGIDFADSQVNVIDRGDHAVDIF